jgi:Putative sugar-binding domain
LKETFKKDEHPLGCIALPYEGLTGIQEVFLRMTKKPINLVLRQVRKCRDLPQFRWIITLQAPRIKGAVAIAGGARKAQAILGGGGLIDVSITDQRTAEALAASPT